MTALVIDASATVPLLLDDEKHDIIPEAQDAIQDGTCIVPGNWPWEMANIVWKSLRSKRIKQSEVEQIRAELAIFSIKIDGDSTAAAWTRTLDLACQYDLTAYDAAYLELAVRQGAVLASFDADLRKAAVAEGLAVLPA